MARRILFQLPPRLIQDTQLSNELYGTVRFLDTAPFINNLQPTESGAKLVLVVTVYEIVDSQE